MVAGAPIGAYNASKAALIHLTRQLAGELGPTVRVNGIAPAVVKTDFAKALYESDEQGVADRYPMKRLGVPNDTSKLAAFLLSDDAAWITGQTVVIDGGITSRRRALMADRVALVTGSTSGIGAAVVATAGRGRHPGRRSTRRSSVDAGAAMVAELGPDHAHYVQGDIADPADAARLVAETVERFGRLDVLVNNAGTTVRIPHDDFDAASPEVFRRLFEVNVIGTWQVTVAAHAAPAGERRRRRSSTCRRSPACGRLAPRSPTRSARPPSTT